MSLLTRFLGLSSESNDRVAEGAEKLKTATEFLSEAAERLEEPASGSLTEIVETALPWVGDVADAVSDAVPPVKAILKIIGLLARETDTKLLGLLTFSLAYQASVAEAVKAIEQDHDLRAQITGRVSARAVGKVLSAELGNDRPEDFEGFRLETALSHRLVKRADLALQQVAEVAGYPESLRRDLVQRVHRRLVDQIRAIISDGRVKDKFDPVVRFLSMDSRTYSTHAAIDRHIRYQLWRFNYAPALGREGTMSVLCPLKEIFVPLDCGVMTWGEIRELSQSRAPSGGGQSAFDESCGGRTDMLAEVIRLIGDPSLNDVIVIQGVAGSGKSTFTLQLCSALNEQSLRPIRIRMRDLSLDPQLSLLEDIRGALLENCGDDTFDTEHGARPSASDLDLSHLLDESVPFGGVNIAPNVLIFDGWDEISISASEGFRIRIEKTLAAIRQLQLGHTHRVRIILTGRPSEDVNQAKFLQERTPVLTVRPLTKSRLEGLAQQLLRHRRELRFVTGMPGDLDERIAGLLKQFDEDVGSPGNKGQSILGLPLIGLLAIWLVLNDNNPPEDLLTDRTSLYRRLVDLTCPYGGNVVDIGATRARIVGDELRNLLRHTAAAMTMRGTEQISNDELVLRLEAEGLIDAGSRTVMDDELAKLRLSFFFIPGPRERGGEFIHKSFREYLFAEAIVEGVKRIAPGGQRLPRRTPYWKDFDESDPRSAAVEELGRLLGPQWLMQDVAKHVRWLIAWEIRRAQTASTDWQERDETQPIDIRAWAVVRDVLADLWDWWGEGVHLRAQPQRERGGQSISFIEPYAVRLSKEITPTDLPRGVMPEPVRVATLDAHLGDALFRLNCAVHFEINRVTGWLARPTNGVNALSSALWEDSSWDEATDHPYQTKIGEGQGTWVAFAPAGRANSIYFRLYCHRINSAGWRPGGFFPSSVDMSGVDFAGSNLALSVLGGSSFQYARLSKAFVGSAYLEDCDFGNCAADGLQLIDATINNSDFSGADLRQANFRAARVCASRLATACVEQLKCTHALFVDIDRSDLAGADTSLAQFAKSPYSRFDSPESSSQPTS